MMRNLFPGYSIGTDAYEDIPAVCPRYGKKYAIIGGHKALAAAEEMIRAQADKAGLECIGTFWYGGEASYENRDWLEPMVTEADMLFGVGGGKAIDTTKILAHKTNRPFFTFPTIASTCAGITSLAVVYHPDGSMNEIHASKIPPVYCFINPQIIANAPEIYLWAGMGDTMAKFYEATVSSRGQFPDHNDSMGIALSSTCARPITRWGAQAMADCRAHTVTHELTEVILSIIASTGFVSNFVQVDYTTGMAHAIYNGTTVVHSVESNHHLHGEIVAYGVLCLLTSDRQFEEREKVFKFAKSIGLPTKLADIDATVEDAPTIADKGMKGIDVRVWPYPCDRNTLIQAMMDLEEYNRQMDAAV